MMMLYDDGIEVNVIDDTVFNTHLDYFFISSANTIFIDKIVTTHNNTILGTWSQRINMIHGQQTPVLLIISCDNNTILA